MENNVMTAESLDSLSLVQQVIQEEVGYLSSEKDQRTAAELMDDVYNVLTVEYAYKSSLYSGGILVVLVAQASGELLVRVQADSQQPDRMMVLKNATRALWNEYKDKEDLLPPLHQSGWLHAITVDAHNGVQRIPTCLLQSLTLTLSHERDCLDELDDSGDVVREQVEALVQLLDPTQLESIDDVLEEFKGREGHLVAALQAMLQARATTRKSRSSTTIKPSMADESERTATTVDLSDEGSLGESWREEADDALGESLRDSVVRLSYYEEEDPRQAVEELVQMVDPTMLDQVDAMMEQFQGRELELLSALQRMDWIESKRREHVRTRLEELLREVDPQRTTAKDMDDLMNQFQHRESVLLEGLEGIQKEVSVLLEEEESVSECSSLLTVESEDPSDNVLKTDEMVQVDSETSASAAVSLPDEDGSMTDISVYTGEVWVLAGEDAVSFEEQTIESE